MKQVQFRGVAGLRRLQFFVPWWGRVVISIAARPVIEVFHKFNVIPDFPFIPVRHDGDACRETIQSSSSTSFPEVSSYFIVIANHLHKYRRRRGEERFISGCRSRVL